MKKALSLFAVVLLACPVIFALQSSTPKDPVPEYCQMFLDEYNGMKWSPQKVNDTFGNVYFKKYELTEADKKMVIDMMAKHLKESYTKAFEQAMGSQLQDEHTHALVDKQIAQALEKSMKTFTAQINNCKTFDDLIDAFNDLDI